MRVRGQRQRDLIDRLAAAVIDLHDPARATCGHIVRLRRLPRAQQRRLAVVPRVDGEEALLEQRERERDEVRGEWYGGGGGKEWTRRRSMPGR